ncbi:MAG TPA: DUF4097 family beta strand repeat-containing protein [Gemmatimonadaceae bacterium]
MRLLPTILATTALAAPLQAQRSDFHWDKAIAAGSTVAIHNITGDVRVTTSTSGHVEVNGIKRGNSRYFDRIHAEVHESSRGIDVCVLYDDTDSSCDDGGIHMHSDGNRDNGHASMDLEIAIPANLGALSAASVSGDVFVNGARGDISANSVSGDVRLEHLHASTITAHTVSGDVLVQADELIGRGDLSFKSVSGNVTLEVPRTFEADLSMSTVSGDVDSDFSLTLGNGRMNRHSVQARIGNGGRRLDVGTVSGDLKLRIIR